MYDFYKHRDHLVRFDGRVWKDITETNKPKFTHQQLASRFDIWTEAQKDNGDFEFIRGFDYAYEDDLKDAIKLIENFNSIKSGDKHKVIFLRNTAYHVVNTTRLKRLCKSVRMSETQR
ncbi:TPA: hypothetical protein ACQ7Z3_000936 [Escherichia coli]